MIIGVPPKEVKNHEYRVAMVPAGAKSLVRDGHTVMVETSSGVGSGILDEDYAQAGAIISPSAGAKYSSPISTWPRL